MTHGTYISHWTCDRIRRLRRRGYMYETIRRKLDNDPSNRTLYYHTVGECSCAGEEPPVEPSPFGNTDPSVPSITSTKNYNG